MARLLPETKKLLKESDERYEDIARGASVKLSWLYMFSRDEIPNPGVLLVQQLYDYLSRPRTKQSVRRSEVGARA